MARILVVDDDPDIIEACQLILESEGHQVGFAESRPEAVELISSFEPDLLILDVVLERPDDGIVLARSLRDAGDWRPILLLTSLGKVTGLEFPDDDRPLVDAICEKPILAKTLLAKVKELMARVG